jgi:hypothetical protein
MNRQKLENALISSQFILAGFAKVTFKSLKTGKHFTFEVIKKANDKNNLKNTVWFVRVLAGNFSHYVGLINSQLKFHASKRRLGQEELDSMKAFRWSWGHLVQMSFPKDLEVWHEGRCGKCGRSLTDPESIASGFGPKCRRSL